MGRFLLLAFAVAAAAWSSTIPTTAHAQAVSAGPAVSPPRAERRPFIVRSLHGDRVDEYHWLRDDDPKAKRPEVVAHLEAENAWAASRMAPTLALQSKLLAEMRNRAGEASESVPVYDGGWWYWNRFEPGGLHPISMRQRGTPERMDPDAPPQVVLDQPRMTRGSAYFAVGGMAVSPDGQWLAWAEDYVGRRVYTLRIRNLVTGEVLPDVTTGVLESLAWANDNRTLFYIRQDPVLLQSGPVWRHVRGTDASQDRLVYEEKDRTQFVGIDRSASGRHLLIRVGGFDTSETLAVPADAPATRPRVVLQRKPRVRHQADHLGGRWIVQTNEGAPNFRLVSAPEATPEDRSRWRTLVPARRDAALEAFSALEAGIAYEERVNTDTRVRWIPRGGTHAQARTVFEASGSAVSLLPARDAQAAHVGYSVSSLVSPPRTFDHHVKSGRSILRKQRVVPGYDESLYESRRVWITARDGARVPVSLAWRRDRAGRDGKAPLYLTGYGAYGIALPPSFDDPRISLLDRGFVVAIAHVRGGSELGQAWYEAGRLLAKHNTFHDFIDVTDGLLALRWGAPDKVFAAGGSAGGLLMGAVANLAGMRYRAMALHVPFLDVLTSLLDQTIPLTVNEWSQWGDPRRKRDYDYILSYAPYDNLRAQPYPAMLVTTALWDSQVPYWEPAKYVARLRERRTNSAELLLYTNLHGGHGVPVVRSGRQGSLDQLAIEYAFFLAQLGIKE